MRLFLPAARLTLGVVLAAWATPACYTSGNGSLPPISSFYFPTGLAVSRGGNVLYAINSDFDLQWSGGTLQSYDLFQIRHDTAVLIQANLTGTAPASVASIPFVQPYTWAPGCQQSPPAPSSNGQGVELGESCAPPVDATQYVRDAAIIGAFATDLQLSNLNDGTRLFAPVAGSATVTWADVGADDPSSGPSEPTTGTSFAPFALDCGIRSSDQRCNGDHQVGNDPNSEHNTRNVTMPGEPFGMAQTQDGMAIAVTSETDTKTSLLTTGFGPDAIAAPNPTMQFVLDGLPVGGVGIAAIPHDPLAVRRCEDVGNQPPCVRQAFLETTRAANEIDLLRYYDDDGSSLQRPFLNKDGSFAVTTNSAGSDSRGIVIDPSPRILCKRTATTDAQKLQCAQLPARVFVANRTPSTIVVGELGHLFDDGTYDPDSLSLVGNVPLTDGPSKVFIAPIVNAKGYYELRLFVVCYDTSSVFIYDPDTLGTPDAAPEAIVYTGPGPYALAFDPYTLDDVDGGVLDHIAKGTPVETDTRQTDVPIKKYRFAYLASFRDSFVQVIDLDASSPETFERVVFTLGQPTPPIGS